MSEGDLQGDQEVSENEHVPDNVVTSFVSFLFTLSKINVLFILLSKSIPFVACPLYYLEIIC